MSFLKLILSAILPIFLVIGVLFINRGSQDTSLAQLERLSGGDFCSESEVKDGEEVLGLIETPKKQGFEDGSFTFETDLSDYRRLVVRKFDTAETKCLDLSVASSVLGPYAARQTNFRRNAGSIDIDGRRLPLIISRSEADGVTKGSNDYAQTIYVRVGGGPGGVNVTKQLDAVIDYLKGDYLIDFYYTGHGFNIVHPNPSFDIAVAQLKAFLEQLRARNPESRIVVIGESLGAVLSAEALKDTYSLSHRSKLVADKLVLLSPPFGSLERTVELLEELQIAHGMEGIKYPYRLRAAGQNYNDYGNLVELDAIDVFRRFYPERQGAIGLAERVSKLDGLLPILVIYGNADVRIDLDKANDFAGSKISNVSVKAIEGMEHQPVSLEHINFIRDEIGYFVDD